VHFLKSFIPSLIIIGLLGFLALNRPAGAAPPDTPPAQTMAQRNGVTLAKKASAEAVELGQVVTYTVTIKNEGGKAIDFTLTDQMPEGLSLALQTHSISTTLGTFDNKNNTLSWSGNLPQSQAATIIYHGIPPSTDPAGRALKNTAKLEFGGTSLEASATITTKPKELGFWGYFVNFIVLALIYLDELLAGWGIPYAFGFAIILLTVLVRAVTYPLNMQQIKSSKAMQDLQPRMKELQEKFKNDREGLAQAQMKLYQEAGVNPLMGCLPMLVQMPVWIALYNALSQLSHEGLLYEGFFWIPSLAGPVADRGGGMGWLWPLPPSIGWLPALSYLVLPVLLVVSQYYMQQMMTPPNPDPQQASMNQMMKIMPIMFGYFSLIVPSGLTLYWFTSNILALVQQYFTMNPKPATAPAGASLSAPVSASSVAANAEEDSKNDSAKAKRKPRRKR
jgi:YidC/Oxa1 family membrane protein insertase